LRAFGEGFLLQERALDQVRIGVAIVGPCGTDSLIAEQVGEIRIQIRDAVGTVGKRAGIQALAEIG